MAGHIRGPEILAANLSFATIFWAVPRAFQKAGEFTFSNMPDQLDNFFAALRQPGSIIADATSASSKVSSVTRTTQQALPTTSQAAASASWMSKAVRGLGIEHLNSLDGVFGYFASRWGVSTFMIAIILNRARVYSSSRRRLRLNWYSRLILRIVPIVLFLLQMQTVLQAMRCQTGNLLPVMDALDGTRIWNGGFAHEGGPVHWLSSTLLSWQSEEDSCLAAGMLPTTDSIPNGSSSVLWPMFLCLCLSHLLETMSCALEGRTPVPETAMTLFEHSLAFAEAEAVVRGSVGLGLFGPIKRSAELIGSNAHFHTLTRSMVLQRLNVPPEVLLIAFISSCSHLSNHVLGVLGLQSRFRLVNTSVWGMSFISTFVWSFLKFARPINEGEISTGVLRYPTVCIIGFIPHLLILASVMVCGCIYAMSLLVTVLSPPTQELLQTSWHERLRLAHDNLQASTALAPLNIKSSDEFYTTLLKIGFNLLTAASEAVYFNEGIAVAISRSTWLEEKRMSDVTKSEKYLAEFKTVKQGRIPSELEMNEGVAEGLNLVDAPNTISTLDITSGYARQKTAAKTTAAVSQAATREEGVGGTQRSGRWYMSWLLLREDSLLVARLALKGLIYALRLIAPRLITEQISTFASPVQQQVLKLKAQHRQQVPQTQDFWILSEDGSSHRASDTNVDVETEVRKQFDRIGRPQAGVDNYLYNWWRNGGFFGEVDTSGSYEPSTADDDDTTSMISESDASTILTQTSDWEDDDDDDDDDLNSGQRTPTQRSPRPTSPPFTCSSPTCTSTRPHDHDPLEPDENLLHHLTQLLDPTTPTQKHEAKLLASRLRRSGPTTRAAFAKERFHTSLRLLSGRGDLSENTPLSPEQEEEVFERIILSRRREALTSTNPTSSTSPTSTSSTGGATWSQGAEGMGSEGPQCVVCHCAPRTILLWPCRCLCLCEDCRVTMALNNFGTCVTCRRDVVAFSRLFVP